MRCKVVAVMLGELSVDARFSDKIWVVFKLAPNPMPHHDFAMTILSLD